MERYGRHTVKHIENLDTGTPADSRAAELRNVNHFAREAQQIDAQLRHSVDRARMAGASWSEIGTYLGISKQAAQQRYGSR